MEAVAPFAILCGATLLLLARRRAGVDADVPPPRPAPRPVREVTTAETRAPLSSAIAAYLASSDAAELGRAVRELFVVDAMDSFAARGAAASLSGGAAPWAPADPLTPGAPGPLSGAPSGALAVGAAAASRTLLTSELTKLCVYTAFEAGGETGERLCSALAQLTLTGQLSPGGSAHALRVLAGRLSSLRRDFPGALRMLAAFAAWLAECGAVPEDALEARGAAAEAAFAEAGRALGWTAATPGVVFTPPSPGALSADVLEVAAAVRQLLRSREPSQLSQVRAMYGEALTAYLRSGGAGISAMVRALAATGAQWTRNELARALLRAFLSPPWAHVGALQLEGGPGSDGEGGSDGGVGGGSEARDHAAFAEEMPIWAVHELCVGLLLELHARGLVDSLAVAAAAEATLRDLPELCVDVEDAPGLFGAALLTLCAEGAISEGWLEGKHASLGGLTLAGAVAARAESVGLATPAGGDPGGVAGTPTPAAPTPPAGAPPSPLPQLRAPHPQASPPLGPLPQNAWAGHVSAARGGGGGAPGGAQGGAAAAAAPAASWVAVQGYAHAPVAPLPDLPPLELDSAAGGVGEPAPVPSTGGAPLPPLRVGGAASPARSPIASLRSPPRSSGAPLSLSPREESPAVVWEARAPAMLALALASAALSGEGGAMGGEPGLRETAARLKRLGLLGGAALARGSALTLAELRAAARAVGEDLAAAAAFPGGGSATHALQTFSTGLLRLGGDWSRLLANEAVRAAVWRSAVAAGAGDGAAAGAGHRVAVALAGLHRRGVLRARCIRLGVARACEDIVAPLPMGRGGALKMAPREERDAAAAAVPHVLATLAVVGGGGALGGRPFFPDALPEALAGELSEDEDGEGALAAVAKATAALTAEMARGALSAP
jgi:hypothetical protein